MPLLTLQTGQKYNLYQCLTSTSGIYSGVSSRTDANLPGSCSYWHIQSEGGGIAYLDKNNPNVSATDHGHRLTGADDANWESAMLSNTLKLEEIWIFVDTNGTKLAVITGTL